VLVKVAAQLADLHRRSPAPTGLRDLGRVEAMQQLWSDGLEALRPFPELVSDQVREQLQAALSQRVDADALARAVDNLLRNGMSAATAP